MVFPINKQVTDLDNLPDGSQFMHSVVRGRNDYDLPAPPAFDSPQFKEELERFINVRTDVVNGVWPSWYFEDLGINPEPPEMFKQFGVTKTTPKAAAELVDHSMDHPNDLHNVFMQQVGGTPKLKTLQGDRKPEQAGQDFLGARLLDAEISVGIYQALLEAFQAKYYFVYTRPEHYYQAGRLVAEYSCPPHPSYPAGHATIAGLIFGTWDHLVELTETQRAEFLHAAKQYGHYRLFAGVHWSFDNTAGFELGIKKAEHKHG